MIPVLLSIGFKRSEDGSLVLATENGQKSLYDILEEVREEVALQNLDPEEDEEEIEEAAEGLLDEKPHIVCYQHFFKESLRLPVAR